MSNREEAGAAVQRALATCMGPGAAEQLALAQVRLAWSEVMADARLERGPLSSRVARVTGGTAHVEASDPTPRPGAHPAWRGTGVVGEPPHARPAGGDH